MQINIKMLSKDDNIVQLQNIRIM